MLIAAPDALFAIVAPLISAVSGLVGVGVGGIIASHNQKKERQQRFIRDQLTEFYAPLLGMRERLRASGDIRLKVRNAAGKNGRALWSKPVKVESNDCAKRKSALRPRSKESLRMTTSN